MQWSQKNIEKAEAEASMCICQGTLSFCNSNCWISDNNKNNSNSFLESRDRQRRRKTSEERFLRDRMINEFFDFYTKKGKRIQKIHFYFDTKLLRTFERKKVNVKHLCWLAQNPAHIQFQGIQRKSFDSMEMFLDEVFMIKTQKDRRSCESGRRGACAPLLY